MLFLVASVGLLQRSGRLRMMSGGAGGFVRLDKLLADRGAGSRKDVDRLIRKGLVELENPETGSYEVVGKSGGKLKVPWDACPLVDGFDYPPPPLLAAYHKPLGVVSSMKDDKGRPDLASVLPQPWQKALHPVGRLDADTTGLLLFCRDGDLTHRLLHPKYVVEREYVATVEGAVDEELLRGRLAAGVETVEEGEPFVVQGELLSVEGQRVRCVFREGKYRMVRRVLANCGHPVVALHRERYGAVRLDQLGLEEGEAAPVEDVAWLSSLRTVRRAGGEQAGGEAGKEARRESATGGGGGRGVRRAPSDPRDVETEMAAAARREWQPPVKLVELVAAEGDVTRDAAVELLRRHEGDPGAALAELGVA